jgi:hypothetical protein
MIFFMQKATMTRPDARYPAAFQPLMASPGSWTGFFAAREGAPGWIRASGAQTESSLPDEDGAQGVCRTPYRSSRHRSGALLRAVAVLNPSDARACTARRSPNQCLDRTSPHVVLVSKVGALSSFDQGPVRNRLLRVGARAISPAASPSVRRAGRSCAPCPGQRGWKTCSASRPRSGNPPPRSRRPTGWSSGELCRARSGLS